MNFRFFNRISAVVWHSQINLFSSNIYNTCFFLNQLIHSNTSIIHCLLHFIPRSTNHGSYGPVTARSLFTHHLLEWCVLGCLLLFLAIKFGFEEKYCNERRKPDIPVIRPLWLRVLRFYTSPRGLTQTAWSVGWRFINDKVLVPLIWL